MKRTALVVAVVAAVAASVLAPILLLAEAASCSVTVSSYADSVLNPPSGEDTDFFVSSGGVPNIMFILDTSGSMRRLPPDGASTGWGSFGSTYGCTNGWANNLKYNSPCGNTVLDGRSFNDDRDSGGQPPDFATGAVVSPGVYCPYMDQANQPPKTNGPGFDPDFYAPPGSKPWLFESAKVYHDTIVGSASDGWTDSSTSPAAYTTIAGFCDQWSATTAKKDECVSCMRSYGYFFDGSFMAAGSSCGSTDDCKAHNEGTCIADSGGAVHSGTNDGSAHCKIPNVWFSGNFLNFFPPKFVVARKVLKDVLYSVKKVRLGLTVFNNYVDNKNVAHSEGGDLKEALNPPCSTLRTPGSYDSNRGSIKTALNGTAFHGGAPLAETLLDVGNHYLSESLPWFNSDYDHSSFEEKSGQNKSVCYQCQASAAVVISGSIPTFDGKIPGTDFAAVPMTTAESDKNASYGGKTGFNVTGIGGTDCDVCDEKRNGGVNAEAADSTIAAGTCAGQQASGACDDAGNAIPAYLPKVAWYLQHMDLRVNTEKDQADDPMDEKQTITTYTIGLGARGAAAQILQDTAEAGGGLYNGGSGTDVLDARALRAAIMRVLEDVNTRSTSFGAASMSTLQVASTQGVLVPRFEPARSAHWDGHLYAFDLFSEFAAGCTPAAPDTSGPNNGDFDCDGKCASVFLKDADGDFIQEDSSGAFRKNSDPTRAPCGGGSRCVSPDCSNLPATNPLRAEPFWDAGDKLTSAKKRVKDDGTTEWIANPGYLPWNERNIYTVIDSNRDGKFDSHDRPLKKLGDADAPASEFVPYLNIKGTRFCSGLAARLLAHGNTRGTTISTELASGTYTTCAQVILDFVRGADVFNENPLGCSSFPDTYCSRKYQLGDIFHSSPIEVWAPLASDGWACPRGLHPQCLTSLFSASIPNPSTATPHHANAYDDYAKSDQYKKRKKFVLVGANDGMLHAFRIERTDSKAGEEIWGFIPPDLLPKLKLLMEGVHQFYVDATPMVRDVWLDDADGNKLGSNDPNGIREGSEFHTVAVVGERRGGTHYFALDVTDASDDLDGAPKFMWLYPQPNDPEELAFGETYVEFLPKPPPIGPVRIDKGPAVGGCTHNQGQYQDGAGDTRCFEERWVVFLSGGFDPMYTKGRGVHMVDLATGDEIWDFSQTCDSVDDPRCFLNFPVAATVGMMMWGKQAEFLSAAAVDGYFDTATFGDTGGQLWVLRFNDPGKRDADHFNKVTNWYGARVFQTGLGATTPKCDYCGGQPFFYITSNLPLAANGLYRTLNGTGDRFNILDPAGGVCGPDNIRACLLKGCTVKLQDASAGPGAVYGVEPLLGTQSYGMNHPALCSGFDPSTYTHSQSVGGGASCSTLVTKIDGLVITCPGSATCSTRDETTTKRMSVTCNEDHCEPGWGNEPGMQIDLRTNTDKKNWFYSIQVFERAADTTGGVTRDRTIFHTLDGAKAYDAARLTGGDLKNVNAFDASGLVSDLATPDGKGWSYFFDHGDPSTPNTVTIDGVARHIYRTDERVTSPSTVEYGCAFWNTLQAAINASAYQTDSACPADSPCKAGKKQVSYVYAANAGTGAMCLTTPSGTATRSTMQETLAPPTIGKMVAYVGQGQVAFGLTSVRVPQGGANLQLGEAEDLVSPVEWLPVDRATHACRHAPKATAPDNQVCR